MRLQPKWKPWICVVGAAGVSMLLGLISVLSTDEGFSKGFGQGYGGFWITLTVTLLFLGLYRVQPGKTAGKCLAWMAGGCFEGYILSRLLDVWVYDLVPNWHSPEKYPLIFLCVTVPIFIASVCMGKLVHWLTTQIMKLRFKSHTPV